MSFKIVDLFSGIGGFSLAASWVWGEALEIACFCEMDPFCQKVLKKHWTNVPIVEDVNDVERIVAYARSSESRRIPNIKRKESVAPECCDIDLLVGGPPCQPASTAGLRKGSEDIRWLWPQTLKVIEAVRPRWILLENPFGITSLAEPICKPHVESKTVRRGKNEDVYQAVLTQQETLLLANIIKGLKSLGYQFPEACDGTSILPVIPASSVGAPHRRDRVWIVANAIGNGNEFRRIRRKDSNVIGNSQKEESKWNNKQHGFEPSNCHASDSIGINDDHAGHGAGQVCRKWREATEVCECDVADSESREALTTEPGGLHTKSSLQNPRSQWDEHWLSAVKRLCGVDAGLPARMDRHRTARLKALGNSIVPQVAAEIMKAIKFVDNP